VPRLSYYSGMTDANNLTSVTNSDQAIQEFVGGQFIVWLVDYIIHEVGRWPVMAKIENAKAEGQKLRKFLTQLFLVQQAMWSEKDSEPGFLKFALANLSESSDPAAEPAVAVLESRFSVKSGDELRVLWVSLFQVLGLTAEELMRLEPKEATRNYIAELSELYSSSEWPTGLGALVCYWTLIGPKFKAIRQLCCKLENYSVKDFEIINSLAVYETQGLTLAHELLEKLSFDHENKYLIWDGVQRHLSLEQEFLNHTVKYLD